METISTQFLDQPTFTARIPCTFYRFEQVVVIGKDGKPTACYSIHPNDVTFSD